MEAIAGGQYLASLLHVCSWLYIHTAKLEGCLTKLSYIYVAQ